MRLHFQRQPWDLYAVIGYTVVVTSMLLLLGSGNLVAIMLVLFVPGYVLVAALFPRDSSVGKSKIDWMDRLALSLGLSIALVPLLGLLLNFTPWGVGFASIIVTMASFTVGVGVGAYLRRIRLPAEQRLSATLELVIPSWGELEVVEKGLAIGLAASVIVAFGAATYIILTPRPGEPFTEFYILGEGGAVSGYPTALNVSQPRPIILGIANHESARVAYTVRIDLVGVRLVYNSTLGFNETVEINRTTLSVIAVTLVDGANWTYAYTISIDSVGLWQVQFLLFKDGDLSSFHRKLYFLVRVS